MKAALPNQAVGADPRKSGMLVASIRGRGLLNRTPFGKNMMKSLIIASLLAALSLFSACGTLQFRSENGRRWVGRSMSEVEQAYGRPTGERIVEKGQKEYFHQIHSGYGACTLYWVVDDKGTVVDWRHEGGGCTQAWSIHF